MNAKNEAKTKASQPKASLNGLAYRQTTGRVSFPAYLHAVERVRRRIENTNLRCDSRAILALRH